MLKELKELQQILNRIFNLVSNIPVSGDNVEIMANAKSLLRTAFSKAGEMTEIVKENPPEECTEEVENG